MIEAKIITDSINEFGNRLTTFVLVFPRIVLAEFNTHRVLSRNSASSRAIPFAKMVKMVEENPFVPIKWMKEHTGMQGTDYFTDEEIDGFYYNDGLEKVDYKIKTIDKLKEIWLGARTDAIRGAKRLSELGLTKQVCNRPLESFMWHTVICTGSEWENFFALRAHPDAEIHIQLLAEKMLEAYNTSTPKVLIPGQWHIPFGDTFDEERLKPLMPEIQPASLTWYFEHLELLKVRIATARCARISYLTFEGKDDYEADIKLHDRLLKSGHMSPFEHCAKAMDYDEYHTYISGKADEYESYAAHAEVTIIEDTENELPYGWCGNFRGFIQYRKMIPGENKTDNRIKK